MFWDNNLQADAIQTFLSCSGHFGSQVLFEQGHATELFFRLYKRRRSYSHGERILLEIALDFWNGQGNARFADLYQLNAHDRSLVFSLYQALCSSSQAVQAWIEAHSPLG